MRIGVAIMADRIIKKYNVSAQGLLTIDSGRLYINCEDGVQDLSLAELLEDFDGRTVKISVSFDEEYGVETTEELGEII